MLQARTKIKIIRNFLYPPFLKIADFKECLFVAFIMPVTTSHSTKIPTKSIYLSFITNSVTKSPHFLYIARNLNIRITLNKNRIVVL